MKAVCFISSYAPDFPWLEVCLRTLRHYAKGFMPPIVCVDSEDLEACRVLVSENHPEARVVIKNARPGQGFMRAQVAMMQADIYSPDADVIFFLGSDCLAVSEFRPEPYCTHDGRPAVLMSPYSDLEVAHPGSLKWRPGTTRVLGIEPRYEFMRRLPSVYPKAVFRAMRMHVERRHGMPFDDYIHLGDLANQDTSEANILGAYAYQFMPATCEWVNIGEHGVNNEPTPGWPNAIVQLHSWSGFQKPTDRRSEINGVSVFGRTPADIIAQVYADMGAK